MRRTAGLAAARLTGIVLGGVFDALGRVRRADKPLHPRGRVHSGTLRRHGVPEPTGVGWLDQGGVDDVVVRVSRSAGFRPPVPDVFGLAIRFPVGGGGHADLLLSSTGTGPTSRFVMHPARGPDVATYCTMFPYRTPTGAVVLGLTPTGRLSYDLRIARPRGPWTAFGDLRLGADSSESGDTDLAFDAVLNPLPGLQFYDWVVLLREPSYRAARRRRGDMRAIP